MTTLVETKCDGGQWTCSPPKECCKQGCCFIFSSSIYKGAPPSLQSGSFFNPLFLSHWYFWLAVTATVAGILCACSLWRKHSQGNLCCRNSSRDERASEPDSNGSCYAPPQYSRCNSFHQAPPPYSEVTSKPDLYPLVISCTAEPVTKSSNGSTGYLMVQYFRNFIVRPVGSLSATSTIDSISSSFLCNATNEANSIFPPSYSRMGSLEELSSEGQTPPSQQQNVQQLPRSSSSTSNAEVLRTSSSVQSQLATTTLVPPTPFHQRPTTPKQSHQVSITDNPCFDQNTTNLVNSTSSTLPNSLDNSRNTFTENRIESKCQSVCDALASSKIPRRIKQRFSKEDSESQDDEHNFSDLLNLSVCVPSSVIHSETIQSSPQNHGLYSVTNSIGSDISSLANLGSPGSPPRATSPTVEMKELLDKIQQLPQQKSPINAHQEAKTNRNYFHKIKAKTLYMPLCDENAITKSKNIPSVFSKSWMSRSAPCTPSGNYVPNFTMHHKGGHRSSQKGSKTKISDGSPLLKEQVEESEDESNVKDEHL